MNSEIDIIAALLGGLIYAVLMFSLPTESATGAGSGGWWGPGELSLVFGALQAISTRLAARSGPQQTRTIATGAAHTPVRHEPAERRQPATA